MAGRGGGHSAVDASLGGVAAHRQLLRAAPVPPEHRRVRARGGGDGWPGCVRYVASLAPGTTTGEVGIWAREKLLEIDDDARRLAYAVVGSSMGLGSYVATMSIVVGDQEEEAKEPGCRLVWAFECEPVQGWTRDGLLGYLDGGVKAIAARMEEAHAAASASAGGDGVVVVAA